MGQKHTRPGSEPTAQGCALTRSTDVPSICESDLVSVCFFKKTNFQQLKAEQKKFQPAIFHLSLDNAEFCGRHGHDPIFIRFTYA